MAIVRAPGEEARTSRYTLARVLAGLQDGRTYYVVAGDSASTRGLSETRGGTAIVIRSTDTFQILRNDGAVGTFTVSIRGGTHRIGTLGLDLAACAGWTRSRRSAWR